MSESSHINADIIIVGGGHVGLSQALLLGQNDLNVVCIDRDNKDKAVSADYNRRTTAISFGSSQLFRAAHIWDDILPHACPIKDIQIMDGASPVLMDFTADDINLNETPAFGWVVQNHFIHQILYNEIEKVKNIRVLNNCTVKDFIRKDDLMSVELDNGTTFTAPLIIGADGRQSFTREWMDVGAKSWSYDQKAITAIVTHDKPHNNIAIEHFKAEGPLAILPMQDDEQGCHRSSLVWTQSTKTNNAVLNFNEDNFLIALNQIFPDFYGEVTAVQNHTIYPLGFIHAYEYIKPNMVLIGDAAHGIHPIAGQGLNLGLRDVAALSELLIKNKAALHDFKILENYQRQRQVDNIAMAATTDMLNRVFSNDLLPTRLLRKAGLKLLGKIKPAKKIFVNQAMGNAGNLPDIIKNGRA